jgi:hypothetical protein
MLDPDSTAAAKIAAEARPRRRRNAPPPQKPRLEAPAPPHWTRPSSSAPLRPLAAGFSAGAGLALFDAALRSGSDGGEAIFAGALRQRLALQAAAASARLMRRREDEAALRDAEHLALGDEPGPAGRQHRLWRAFAKGRVDFSAATLADACAALSVPPPQNFDAPGGGDPLAVAAQAATALHGALLEAPRAEADILSFWAADVALAKALGWSRPVALLAAHIVAPSLRLGPDGRRPSPRDADWPLACAGAYALAAQEAHQQARALARRAEKLLAAQPKLRAKGASRALEALLADDCASAARLAKISGLSDRAARRLFDRLIDFDAVRELTGRPNFRLYGL